MLWMFRGAVDKSMTLARKVEVQAPDVSDISGH